MTSGNLERRGLNSWRLTVRAGKDALGMRIIFRKTIRAATRHEAELELAKYVAEVTAPGYESPSTMTLKEFTVIWLRDHAERNLEPKTIVGYRSILERRILPALGGLLLARIKPLDINHFYHQISSLKKVAGSRSGGGLSAQTIQHYHRLLNKIFNDATRLGIIEHNPIARALTPKVKPKRLKIEESQVESLLPALESEALRFRVLICLTIGTGMRLGEVTGLEWKHVDLERGFLRVDQSAQYIAGQGIIIKDPKSTSSERNIALPAEVISLLREYKEKQKNYSKKRRQADWVFRHPDGRHMQPHLVSSWFSRFVKRKNLPHMRFHDLRHLSATLSLLAGISPTNVAARLGHSKVSTTMNIYTHALRSVDNLAAEKLNEVITKNKRPFATYQKDDDVA